MAMWENWLATCAFRALSELSVRSCLANFSGIVLFLALSASGQVFAQSGAAGSEAVAEGIASPALIDFPQGTSLQPYLTGSGATLSAGESALAMARWNRAVEAMSASEGGQAAASLGTSSASLVASNVWKASDPSWQDFSSTAALTPVPEPSTYGAILLGAACAWVAFRRYRGAAKRVPH